MAANKHIEMLGFKAEDLVTGFKGVITGINFDLYGCIQAVVTPTASKEGKKDEGEWFDVSRLKIKGRAPVMPAPNFSSGYVAAGMKGGAKKPLP